MSIFSSHKKKHVHFFFSYLCHKEGYTCHFSYHLTPLVHQMDDSAIYGSNSQVGAS
jgi:hypothetical protein